MDFKNHQSDDDWLKQIEVSHKAFLEKHRRITGRIATQNITVAIRYLEQHPESDVGRKYPDIEAFLEYLSTISSSLLEECDVTHPEIDVAMSSKPYTVDGTCLGRTSMYMKLVQKMLTGTLPTLLKNSTNKLPHEVAVKAKNPSLACKHNIELYYVIRKQVINETEHFIMEGYRLIPKIIKGDTTNE